jgi:hypothetical protein
MAILPTRPLRLALVAAIVLVSLHGPAAAYIGPGGGLALLTQALAMLTAFGVSAAVVLSWPYRAAKRYFRRLREKSKGSPEEKWDAEDKAGDR